MDRSNLPPLRSLPRVFLELEEPSPNTIPLPESEFRKLSKVLRLRTGDEVAILPGDGRLLRCQLEGRHCTVKLETRPQTEPKIVLEVCQAIPRMEKLEEVVRMGTEVGVAHFVLFPAERSIVRWDPEKRKMKTQRLQSIAREAAEVSFRTRLPSISWVDSFAEVVNTSPEPWILSESETITQTLSEKLRANPVDRFRIVVGPEGGWAPAETKLIGDRAVSLGPRVLRVDTAAISACALILLAS